MLPIHPRVQEALDALPLARAGPLWRGRFGEVVTPSALSKRMNRYLKGLGITATAHQLRHMFATEVYRLSRDLRLTQELLGHSDPATTAIYTAWDQTAAADVVCRLGGVREVRTIEGLDRIAGATQPPSPGGRSLRNEGGFVYLRTAARGN